MCKFICVLSLAVLAGCATCERHPYVCAVGGAIVVGSAVAIAEAHHGHSDSQRTFHPDYGVCDPRSYPACH